MVEHLKKSLKGLVPPTCPTCRTQMRWYRSELDTTEPEIVVHYFTCATCNRISETKAVAPDSKPPPPSKLSQPRPYR